MAQFAPTAMFSPRELKRVRLAFKLYPTVLTKNLNIAITKTAFSVMRDIQDNMTNGGPTGWTAVDKGNMRGAVIVVNGRNPLEKAVGVSGSRSRIATMMESGTGLHHAQNPLGHLVGLNVPPPPAGGQWIKPKKGKYMRFRVKPRKRRTPAKFPKPSGYQAFAKVMKGGEERTITKTKRGKVRKFSFSGRIIIYTTHIQGMKPRYMLSDAAIKNVPVFRKNVEIAAMKTLPQTLNKLL